MSSLRASLRISDVEGAFVRRAVRGCTVHGGGGTLDGGLIFIGEKLDGGSFEGIPNAVRPTSSPVSVLEVRALPGASEDRTVRGGSRAEESGRPSAMAFEMRRRRSW